MQKVVSNRDDRCVRIESSGGAQYDFEFSSDYPFSEFLIAAQSAKGWTTAQFGLRESTWLTRAFDKRLADLRQSPPKPQARRTSNTTPSDIKLAAMNQQRRVERSQQHRKHDEHAQSSAKRTSNAEEDKIEETLRLQPGDVDHFYDVFKELNGDSHRFRSHLRQHRVNLVSDGVESLLRHMRGRLDMQKAAPTSQLRRSTRSTADCEPEKLEPEPEPLRFSRQYPAALGKEWKTPLIYPPSGKNRVTIEWQDLERLDDGEMLNDNVINFYLKHLAIQLEQTSPELAKRVYWFNSYFFDTVTQGKGARGINYEGVEKWTRKVNLFAYDYVIVPVNESAHWYVAIVCNLPGLLRPTELEEVTKIPSSPPLSRKSDLSAPPNLSAGEAKEENPSTNKEAHSTAPKHRRTTSKPLEVQSPVTEAHHVDEEMLLDEEDKARKPTLERQLDSFTMEDSPVIADADEEAPPSPSVRPTTAPKAKRKSVGRKMDPKQPCIIVLDSLSLAHGAAVRTLKDYLEKEAEQKKGLMFDTKRIQGWTAKGLPSQDNFSDCGVFLLGYIQNFLRDPAHFVSIISQREVEETKEWMDVNASGLRTEIRDLILRLRSGQTGEPMPPQPSPKAEVSKVAIEPNPLESTAAQEDRKKNQVSVPSLSPPPETEDNKTGSRNVRPKATQHTSPHFAQSAPKTYSEALEDAVEVGAGVEKSTVDTQTSSEEALLVPDSQEEPREVNRAALEEAEEESYTQKAQPSMRLSSDFFSRKDQAELQRPSTRGKPEAEPLSSVGSSADRPLTPSTKQVRVRQANEKGVQVITVD